MTQSLTAVQLESIDCLQLYTIAQLIMREWKTMNNYAKQYANAMLFLNSVDDMYGQEDGRTIVRYFLSNAGTWRGDTARIVKAELNRRVK